MPTERPKSALGSLRQALFVRECGGLGDGELLGRFLAQRDEAAFAALVRRHGPMVLGVCRRVLGHAQDAEDAFQATFLVLLRSAASIRKRESVGNWLYGVAYRTSLEARAAAARRHATERQVETMPEPTVEPAEIAGDFRPILDAELSRLPEKYREAVVLCDLEGRPRREAARQLGIPEGTLSSRLAAGRRQLAGRLAGRGITLSAGALAAGLGARTAMAAVPASLVQATVGSALAFTAGAAAAGALPAGVLALTERMMRTMLLARVKQAVVLFLALTFLGTGAGVVWTGATAREPGWVVQADGPAKGAAEQPRESPDVWTLDFHFKAPRPLTTDVPGQGKKTVWYLQYTVINGTGEPHTFIPDLDLVTLDKNTAHHDQVLPKVAEAIRKVEDPTGALGIKDSVTIAAEPIRPSRPGATAEGVNGLALWDGVDPDTTRLSIFVGGLSNAWSVTEPVSPDTKPVVRRKTLQLNFKRAGDRMEFVPPAQWVYRTAPLQPPPRTGRPPAGERDKPKTEPDEAKKRTEKRDDPLFHVGFVDSGTVERDDPGKLIDKLDQRLAVMEQERDELRKQIAALREELRRSKEKTAQAPAGQETEKSEDRLEVVQSLQRQLAGLKAKERDRRIYVEFLIRRVRSLRPPAEQDEPAGIEADRRRERFRAMKMELDHQVQEGDEEETNHDLQLEELISRLLTLQDLPATKGMDRAVLPQIEAVLAAADTARKNWKKEREELRKDVEGLRRELGERPGGRP
jgi:RNA polymerase sigma factor (sigma-70 family)